MPNTTSAPAQPAAVWKALTRLIAAPGRGHMRVWNPATDKFSDTAKLTATLPSRPAAVYLYTKGRTRLLALDFDTKHRDQDAVDADLAQAIAWITQCGGVVVTDRSTSGGRHLLCPLAIGTSASAHEITHLVRLLAARLPTLDITPSTNPTHGCLTPPGSPCKQGGYRLLDGPTDQAVQAFTTRSSPDLLPRLYVLLGAIKPTPNRQDHPSVGDTAAYTVGSGDDLRLAPEHIRHDPLPAAIHDYATRGTLAPRDRAWPSNHEARMAVITAAIWRGHNLAGIRAMIAPGRPWHTGLGAAYHRYGSAADRALARDFTKALNWLIANPLLHRPPQHKITYSQGGSAGPKGPQQIRAWLANAYAWTDREYRGQRYRWTVHAVLQTIALHAAMSGEVINGTPVVGVGGRSLSLGSGLLSADTIWRVLRDLRERPGSPLVLVRSHVGLDADTYALTMQNRATGDPVGCERVRVEPVHNAWFVLGHHLRRIYELIANHGLTERADIFAAAAVSPSTGDAIITELEIAGLVRRAGRGKVSAGPVSLDDIAAAHQLDEIRERRTRDYQAERAAWREWLNRREHERTGSALDASISGDNAPTQAHNEPDRELEAAYLESVMTTGPPSDDEDAFEYDVIELLAEALGARIVGG
ncbi:hypothetical protein [Mycobacterium avium]|uniref:hypothetical protein n=1 Tax=Mycobacterium avium TaxID=1764 RepID=UPI001F2102E6|nr:hypothetical protein [Mycobacterium avium]